MCSKFLTLVLVICFSGIDAVTYQEAVDVCKKEYNVPSDVPLDNFLASGKFQPGEENLKCYFGCVGSKLETADNEGNIKLNNIKSLAAQNPTVQELQVFANDDIQKTCVPAQSSGASVCDNVFKFVECAVQTSLKSKSS